MGIKGLAKLIADNVPNAIVEKEMSSYFGRKVAIDASMSIYQFMIAIRTGPSISDAGSQLMNENGEVTSHLQGLFHRTIRIMSNGIKPVYVFDGKPPTMKGDELLKRTERRDEAENSLKEATEDANKDDMHKFSRRLVKVTPEHNAECQRLLRLMGVPIVLAPCEAEAQCAALASAGLVYATATEDMDALTFGSPVLLRHLTFSQARKLPVTEFTLKTVLEGLELSMTQFIDLCILCGCDYTNSIRGIGPMRAYQLIKTHGNIEAVVEHLTTEGKFAVPDMFQYLESRELFKSAEVLSKDKIPILEWTEPDENGLIKFLVDEKQFSEERVRAGLVKLKAAKKLSSQQRLESFFGASTVIKRKAPPVTKGKKQPAKKKAATPNRKT